MTHQSRCAKALVIVFVGLSAVSTGASASESTDVPEPGGESSSSIPEGAEIQATVTFDDESYYIGVAVRGPIVPSLPGLGVRLFASFRPKDQWTRAPVRPHFFVQRRESYRNLYGVTADAIQMLGSTFGLYGALGYGYSHGNYVGTEVDPGSNWSWVAGAGVKVVIRPWSPLALRIGYERADRILNGNHMAFVAVGAGT